MKTYLLKLQSLGIAAGLTLGAVMVLSMFAWTTASAVGVVDTKHNLGSAGTGINTFSGTAEVCVFCHTPHGADVTAVVPLWNKALATPASYTTYDTLGTTSLDGQTAPVGSVSIACLSCHDGVQAMDAVLNEPGSGLVDATYSAGVWTGANQTAGVLTGVANLGQNLTDDHPIGIQYGGGGITTSTPVAPTRDADFVQAGNGLANMTANGQVVWWVDTEATPNGSREKTDMQLYTRSVALIDGGLAQPFVECASCHDPHSDTPDLFLRVSNDSSAVCLACHVK